MGSNREADQSLREWQRKAAGYEALITRLEARDAVTRIIAEAVSVADAAPRILRAIGELLHWQVGVLWLVPEKSAVLRLAHYWTAEPFPTFETAIRRQNTFAVGVGLPGTVLLTKEPAWIDRIDADPNFPRAAAAASDGITCGFAFPVMTGNEVAGVVEFYTRETREPDENLLQMLVILGHQIGIFFERRRAEEELLRHARLTSLRADTAAALARAGELRTLLTQCTEALVRHLGVAFARIWTLNASERVLELQASSGLYTHINGTHSRIPVGAFKIGWIAEKRQPHLTNHVPDDPRVTDHAWAQREGMQAFAGYPLLIEDRVLGVMAMFARQELDQLVLEELAPIADIIAQFLDRRRALDELRRSESLKTAMLETALDAIVAMNEAGRVVEWNQAAEKMFGYERTNALGSQLANLIIPPQFREAHWNGLRRYLATGEAVILGRRIRITGMRSDGHEFPVELTIVRIPGERPALFTGYIRELPEG
ncbi:MAG TPA: GAF domain-containing protein [Bryobacteraceae bacterium]|nr:GAF domain-containing protein [Bryobacteraceae bacterium]